MKLVAALLGISAASGVFASPVTKTGPDSILDKRANTRFNWNVLLNPIVYSVRYEHHGYIATSSASKGQSSHRVAHPHHKTHKARMIQLANLPGGRSSPAPINQNGSLGSATVSMLSMAQLNLCPICRLATSSHARKALHPRPCCQDTTSNCQVAAISAVQVGSRELDAQACKEAIPRLMREES
ncbi:hypothetical protein K456DRAFT_37645 [Colletotrichum gloeosporioides 23]|nr:hypothetical protein K456DRAFT_37645 [Colletotrichum gloeosporioides 23]